MAEKTTKTAEIATLREAAILAAADPETGEIRAHALIEAAADPAHIMHNEFEWDDAVTGIGFRLIQAHAIIRRYRITVIRRDPKTKKVSVLVTRGTVSRPSLRGPEGRYELLGDVLKDATKREEMLEQALRELEAVKAKYAILQELSDVWAAVDVALEEKKMGLGADESES